MGRWWVKWEDGRERKMVWKIMTDFNLNKNLIKQKYQKNSADQIKTVIGLTVPFTRVV